MTVKKQRKHDGNVAFKVTYNDQNWSGVCSDKLYEYNAIGSKRKAWCSHVDCTCRDYGTSELGIECFPCFDSIAVKELSFSPGFNYGQDRPFECKYVQEGKLALFTSTYPKIKMRSPERFVFAILLINEVRHAGDENYQTIFGCKERSIVLEPEQYIDFWEYHHNPNAPQSTQWGSGLFRYVPDIACRNILHHVLDSSKFTDGQKSTAKELLEHVS